MEYGFYVALFEGLPIHLTLKPTACAVGYCYVVTAVTEMQTLV